MLSGPRHLPLPSNVANCGEANSGDAMTATDPPITLPLRVTCNDEIAENIHLLEFCDLQGNLLPKFSAGAHIAVRVPNGVLRKYSLCNDPAGHGRGKAFPPLLLFSLAGSDSVPWGAGRPEVQGCGDNPL